MKFDNILVEAVGLRKDEGPAASKVGEENVQDVPRNTELPILRCGKAPAPRG